MPQFHVIWAIQDHILTLAPKICTVKELTKDPGCVVPVLRKILSEYEAFHFETLENSAVKILSRLVPSKKELNQKLPKLFSLFPMPSLRWRFIHLNALGLKALMSESKKFGKTSASSDDNDDNSNYDSGFQIFTNVFMLDKYGFDR